MDESRFETRPQPSFEPGLELNRGFYVEVVAPLLEGIPHAAARIGWGSDVLGFDDERSTDHGWGPHLEIFVSDEHVADARHRIEAGLPETYRGWPVRYGWDAVPVSHHVEVGTLAAWSVNRLGFDATQGVETIDWLLVSQQRLLEATSGAVYHDDDGELTDLRLRLAWYPDDVWLWLLACQWMRISQEEAFVGRTAHVGDELGSQIVGARVARDLARLWFLCERTYAPYMKWFGSAFRQLPGSEELGRHLSDSITAQDYRSREAALVAAYELAARRHNDLGLTEALDPTVRPYYGRPYLTLMSERFVEACLEQLEGSALADLPLVGAADQVADSTDVLSNAAITRRLRSLYEI